MAIKKKKIRTYFSAANHASLLRLKSLTTGIRIEELDKPICLLD